MSRAVSSPRKRALVLDPTKINRAKRVLGTTTKSETIARALDEILDEDKRNRRALKAHERFLNSSAQIADVFGNLDR